MKTNQLLATLLTTAALAACANSQPPTSATAAPATNSAAGTAEANIYISPNGDDNNPGTEDKPIQSLNHARDLARTLAPKATSDITITLQPGTYRLSAPLEFISADSGGGGRGGQNAHSIIWKGQPTPTNPVIISGAVPLNHWQEIDPQKHLWAAPAPAAFIPTRQLYINGLRATRTKGSLPKNLKLTETPTGYTASADTLAHWKNPADIEFVYTGGNALWSEKSEGLGPWTEPRIPVAAISGNEITMAQPCWNNSTKRVMLPPSSKFKRTANLVGPSSVGKEPEYIENAFELLGTPGQFYFDRTTHMIYYTPRPGEDLKLADVEAPILESLIIAHGTPDKPIHNITFSNIQFSYATWLYPSSPEGFSEIQANYMVTGKHGFDRQGLGNLVPNGTHPFGAWTKTPGNLSFEYAHNIQFLDDDFVHLGAAGLELSHGSQNNLVQGCVFTDISANGLELGGVDLPQANDQQAVRDNQILDNHFYNTAAAFHGGVAIDVGYTQRTRIAFNQIDHQPYTAISLGWGGWPDKIEQSGVLNISQNALVEHNLIFDHLLLLADGGGIYTQGLTGPSLKDGEKLIANVIHDQYGSGHAIYTDNGCKNVSADNNVIFNTNFDNWGSRHKDWYPGQNGKVYDGFEFSGNYWQQGGESSPPDTTMKDNHMISALDQAPDAIRSTAGIEPNFRQILDKTFTKAAPEPPERVAAAIVNGDAYITFDPPSAENGSRIESYVVTASTGQTAGISANDFREKAYVKLEHVTTNSPTTFTVSAANANGPSAPSLPSAPVTNINEEKIPGPPGEAIAYPGNGMASIHFRVPDDARNVPILGFTCTIHPGNRKVTFTGRKIVVLAGKHTTFCVVDGLTNGTAYTFDLAAITPAGETQPRTTKPITPEADKQLTTN